MISSFIKKGKKNDLAVTFYITILVGKLKTVIVLRTVFHMDLSNILIFDCLLYVKRTDVVTREAV